MADSPAIWVWNCAAEDRQFKRLGTIAPGGGYMIGSANSLTSYCKLENVRAMAAAIRKYRYSRS